MLPPFPLNQAINQLVREEWGRILASLIGSLGDIQLAEDVLQDAVESALLRWRENGIPEQPAAWLLTTAKRRAIDRFRRQSRFEKLQPELAYFLEMEDENNNLQAEWEAGEDIPDKRLELIFTCCHPALDQKTQVALTLRSLGGLSTDEIARAFLDKTSTMAQRLTRAKHKIAIAGIAYEVPDMNKLPERLNGVLAVLYFIFNEGYSASSGDSLTRTHLSDEAIRLSRVLRSLLPNDAEVAGLLCLMLLHDSRRRSREDESGNMIMLEFQIRALWDKAKITEGTELLKQTLSMGKVGPFQLQAAISALHAEAAAWDKTDWPQIVALYELLYAMQPSPVIRINQAVAVSYAQSPQQALQLLDTIEEKSVVDQYQPYRVARAAFLHQVGEKSQAREQLSLAIDATDNEREKEFLTNRLNTEYQ